MNEIDKMEDRAVAYFDVGRLRLAERTLKRMLEIDSNCLGAHFNLARVYRETKEYERGLYHARQILRLSPNEPNARLNLALIYELMGRHKQAFESYKTELSRNPKSAETLWNIGRLYFKSRRWSLAARYLRECFDLGFEYEIEDTVYKLGHCYFKLNDLQSYIEVYSRFVQIDPRASWAFANLGCALLRAKDYKGAVLRLKRADQMGVKHTVKPEQLKAKQLLERNRTAPRSNCE